MYNERRGDAFQDDISQDEREGDTSQDDWRGETYFHELLTVHPSSPASAVGSQQVLSHPWNFHGPCQDFCRGNSARQLGPHCAARGSLSTSWVIACIPKPPCFRPPWACELVLALLSRWSHSSHCAFVLCPHSYMSIEVLDIYVGLVNLRVADNHTQWFEVNQLILHPTYQKHHPVGGDVALVQLKSRIVFSDSVLPVCIAPRDVKLKNIACWATGWGSISPEGKRTKCRGQSLYWNLWKGWWHHRKESILSVTGVQVSGDWTTHPSITIYLSVHMGFCFIPGWLCCIQRSSYIYLCGIYIYYIEILNFKAEFSLRF